MKSLDQRIEDGAAALRDSNVNLANADLKVLASIVIEAADRERPPWPTEESVTAFAKNGGWVGPNPMNALRAAMLVDPIHRAAVACVKGKPPARGSHGYGAFSDVAKQVLTKAVKEAGI